jgi:hypothetical protein
VILNTTQFFVGFCLIANGIYRGTDWSVSAGDAHDLVRLGTPIWFLILFGLVCTGCGLALWHRTDAMSLRAADSREPVAKQA